ncbi:MAG: hypothetical protein LUD81_00210, partial [Clostridiales bacterium]|nr:hypothetical protein [Clostridiales bacterium]
NRADNIPMAQPTESVVNVRDKSDNIIIGTSEKPSLESGEKQPESGVKLFENGEKQPDTSSRPYRSSSKRGLAEQVKNSREETVGDVIKSNNSQAVINNADNTAVIQPAESIVNVREQTAANGIIKGSIKGSDYGQTKEEKPISGKVPTNPLKNARTVVASNKNTENKAKKSAQDIYTAENPKKTNIKGIDSENIIETDVSSEAFTYRDKAKAADVVKYRDGEVKNDIASFKADDSIIEADYKGSVTDNLKALVRDKDGNSPSESGSRSDFSKYVHKKTVNKIQKSVGDSENKAKAENTFPEKNYSENVTEKDVLSEVFTYRDKAKAAGDVKLREGGVKPDIANFKADVSIVEADYKGSVTDNSKALVRDKNGNSPSESGGQSDFSKYVHKNTLN